jgi:hypothetical protein
MMKNFIARLLKNPLPWILVGIHGLVILMLAPIVLWTVNTETAPLGFVVIGCMDLPVLWVTPEWIAYPTWFGNLRSAGFWSFVVLPFIAGTVQWFTIGLLLALPVEVSRTLCENRSETRR